MGNLLFSPKGRIGSSEFMQGGIILIVVAALLSIISHFMPTLAMPLGLVSFLLVIPWVFIWVKRLHNGDKSGWMFLVYLLVYIVLAVILMVAIGGGEIMKLSMEAAKSGMDPEELKAQTALLEKGIFIPNLIGSIVIGLLTLFIGDKTIANDPEENRFGPAN